MTTGISRDPASHEEDLLPAPAAAYDRASWRESAACRQAADPELFFPIGTASIAVRHLAGAVLVSAGVIFALPAISGPLHRTWAIVCRAIPVRRSQRPLTEQPGPIPETEPVTGRLRDA